ncbi:uncharacterized protein F4807DRAFT_178907 [Annulohypoxylon truncatum]|uniref:uncharacterized protein n=1 Tax=Annulohypoxylon truncatum TaxID=327061 RepID=UPI002007B9D9|nr:uncharacterized protein F4807DRAFT_178907 [Annulohypoxylon truncatum]KAI1207456.1 hypothetical protein F4807DRAFT_178907 [Annulohypoxylon truncatum]
MDQAGPTEVAVSRQQRSPSLFSETRLEYLEATEAATVVTEVPMETPMATPIATPMATAMGATAMGATEEVSCQRTPCRLPESQRDPMAAAMELAFRHRWLPRQVREILGDKEVTTEAMEAITVAMEVTMVAMGPTTGAAGPTTGVADPTMEATMEVVPSSQLSPCTSLRAHRQDPTAVQEGKVSRRLTALGKVPPLQVATEETLPDSNPSALVLAQDLVKDLALVLALAKVKAVVLAREFLLTLPQLVDMGVAIQHLNPELALALDKVYRHIQ